MHEARIAELRSASLTYPEVGRTRHGELPHGYRAFRRSVPVPSSTGFDLATHELFGWLVHRRAGLNVTASGRVALDAVADLRIGFRRLSIVAPCRVVYVIDEPGRRGFAYGTLPGHPESGEESFVLEQTPEHALRFTVTAFSRPATTLTKIAGPFGHRVQDLVTSRYLRAFN
ncbi:uncharacterized protein (UPF0548 family) [Jatrophihabitans sp. GAS493]|uniref:DUF1990 family protein n=1 Tax=Jatrophihabitans sp. GAS493 TaxID=1907575 RepID=UPI000BB85349|nr:DUF1990 domain-containing protein [Jatrophihabitans sp. GAS493]SOD72536.1 uncharacterized protein (UPF0548 family) [Jatrophihabitans sp. GAS493]